MNLLYMGLALSVLLCGLVTGFIFAFAIVVMPGIRDLDDLDFLQAFKVMDGVIQKNQPAFILVWLGSVVILVATAITAFSHLEGANLLLITIATAVYILGVQVPTIAVNVPLNNRLQQHDLDPMSEYERRTTRSEFEPRWVRWNFIRMVFATLTSILLIFLIVRL